MSEGPKTELSPTAEKTQNELLQAEVVKLKALLAESSANKCEIHGFVECTNLKCGGKVK